MFSKHGMSIYSIIKTIFTFHTYSHCQIKTPVAGQNSGSAIMIAQFQRNAHQLSITQSEENKLKIIKANQAKSHKIKV